ncbi:MAG: 2Fe-2S iron-sulfur cluster-binding protein [Syntrophorhabdaceae bacterium]|nr:2Fe-2S iron-sulfur cluster-binding protein [Syntrophorhabdaceae bacterium]
MITLKIDGKEIKTEEGKTILEAARDNNIYIPTLCYHENLLPIGSCRLCIVEIDGYEKPMASCTTAAAEGISVTTRSEKLFGMRQEYLRFLLVNHPLDCPICDSAGECRLQDLVFEHKIECVDLAADREPKKAKAYATALIRYSEDRCVLCLRCVHACREVSGRRVLELAGSGIEAAMAPKVPEDCISCGECLSMCPVGALTEQESSLKSRKWQTKRQTTTCPHCGFGCSLDLDVYEDRFITKVVTSPSCLPNRGSLCVMGRFGYDFANNEARLAAPTVKEGAQAVETTLAEAVEATASALTKLDKEGKAIGFVVSSRATNEEAYMISQIGKRFSKSQFGTAGYYHTGKVLETLRRMGIRYPYEYDALSKCDLVVVAGGDLLGNNHLLGNKVREAVKGRGARVAVIDPSATSLTRVSDVWVKVAPGTDALFFNGIASQLIADKKSDPEAQNLDGFSGYAAGGKADAAKGSGADEKSVDRFYALFAAASSVAVIFGTGISSKTESMESLLNLCLVKGVQRTGVVMPIALQSNAVGVLSILPDAVGSGEVLEKAEGLFIYEDDPFHYLGGKGVEESLKKKAFVAACDLFATGTSAYAHVVVPAGSFAEKEGSFVAEDGFMRKVGRAKGSSSPGFEFLRLLLDRLGGGLYRDEAEASTVLFGKEILVKNEGGRAMLKPTDGTAHFASSEKAAPEGSAKPFTLVLRNVFFHHHLAGKGVYSKMVYLQNPAVAGDKLFISPEDAAALGISDGGQVVVESDKGVLQHPATIREGLGRGVLEYRMLRNRQDILKLTDGYGKHIAVTVKKG